MNPTKLIFVTLLVTLFSASSYAKHPHPSSHQPPIVSLYAEIPHHYSVKHHSAKHGYSGYQSTHRHHQFRSQSAYRYQVQYHVNHLSYPGYKHYRSGKPRSLDSHHHPSEHRDNDAQRESYRLIAGALVLSEVLHHVRH